MTPDVLDEHFYMPADHAFADAAHYDKYERKGPKIFVGEWATREGDPTPNLEAALADSAWMTGMERNSDLVIMASYAPLFVNVNAGGMQWATDLIGYNAISSYGSPSYWAQVLFGSYVGTEVVPAALVNTPTRFYTSVTRDEASRKLYIKIVNGTSVTEPLEIALKGADKLAHQGILVTLSGKTPNATNSITHPDDVIPVKHVVPVAGHDFKQTIAPYSVNVLELSY